MIEMARTFEWWESDLNDMAETLANPFAAAGGYELRTPSGGRPGAAGGRRAAAPAWEARHAVVGPR